MEARILKFNQRQLCFAILAAVLSVLGTFASYFFFKYIAMAIWWLFEHRSLGGLASLIGLVITGLVWWEGIRRTRTGAGLYEFFDSPFFMDLDSSSGGAMMVETSVTPYTGAAYALTQLFLCGPLQGSKCLYLLKSRIRPDPTQASRMEALLEQIQQQPKWHAISLYQAQLADLRALINMELVEFSPRTGLVQPSKDRD